jgi:hypothetical protein
MVGTIVEVFYPLCRLSMMTPYRRFPTTEAFVQSVLPFGFLSGFCSRSVPRRSYYSRLAPGGLLFEIGVERLLCKIGEGGGEWCCVKKRERTRKGGGVRGCNILEKG